MDTKAVEAAARALSDCGEVHSAVANVTDDASLDAAVRARPVASAASIFS